MKKWVLVTGANRGIGQAIAIDAAKSGYNLVLHGRSSSALLDTQARIEAIGAQSRTVCFDIADRAQCRQVLTEDVTAHGAPYGVVCNAGMTADAAFPAMTGEDWDRVLRTNLDGFYNVLHPLVMPMIRTRQPGRIIAITSVSGLVGNRGQANYSATKAGIIGASKTLAVELATRRITVNCVAPGIIRTDMTKDVPMLEETLKGVPMARMGEPLEVAGVVTFLLSESASYVTRQVISVNGGMH